MRRALDALGSLRLTIALLVALGALFLVGLAVPQKQVLKPDLYEAWRRESPTTVAALEAVGLTDAFQSPLALALWALFFANLGVVMVRRVPATLERTRIDRDVPALPAPGFVGLRELSAGGGLEELGALLRRRGFAVFVAGSRLRAVKNRYAPVATLLFHLSFVLVAGGAAVSVFTRFEGLVDLGQGEEFTGDLEQYTGPPRLPRFGNPPAVRFLVEGIVPEVEGDVPVGIRVSLRDAALRLRTIEVNRPWDAGPARFVFKNLGVAPLVLVTDPDGRELFGGFIRLDVLQGKKDGFELVGLKFDAELFPDHRRDGDDEGTRSQEMKNPVLRLTATAASGRQVRASLHPGESMTLGPYRVTFADWRWWIRLYVRGERGLGAVWGGFVLGSLALVWRLFYYRREYVAECGADGRLRLAGRADYYRALFSDEVDALGRELERELGGADAGRARTSG